VFTVSYNGFVNGQDATVLAGAPEVSTLADTNSPVADSPYTITAAAGNLSAANYSFTFVSGNLTVTNAVLTVTADDQSKVYGATNPVLTASYRGFVNGEDTNVLTAQASLSTTATDTSPVGPYPITAGGMVASNYSISYVNGTLTVLPPPPPPTVQSLVRAASGDVTITWSAGSTSKYRVQYKNDLSDATWTDITPDVTATGDTASFTDHAATAGQRFYRVVLVLP
jgi:hypothetical protein